MKLINLKCPNCGGKLKVEDDKESAVCIHCDYEFLIDDEQPTINHNYYYNDTAKTSYTPNASKTAKKQAKAGPLAVFCLIVVCLVFVAFVARINEPSSTSSEVVEHFAILAPKTEPETLPIKLFVEYVFKKPVAQISPIDYASIKYLQISRDDEVGGENWAFKYSFEDYDSTKDFDSTIQQLDIDSKEVIEVSDFQVFSGLTALVVPDSSDFENGDRLPPLVNSTTITKFNTDFSKSYNHIEEAINSPEQLKHISVQLYDDLDIENLIQYTNLESINIRYIGENVTRMVELNSLKKLTELKIRSAKDISWISSMSNLRELTLDAYSVENFNVLYGLPNIEKLDLTFVDKIKTLDFVKNMPRLRELSISRSSILNLEPLRDSKSILLLDLEYNFSLSDASAINSLTSLKKLHLKNNAISPLGDLAVLKHLEDLSISGSLLEKTSTISSVSKLVLRVEKDLDASMIPEKFPNLTDLELLASSFEYSENLPSLVGLTMLENLRLTGIYANNASDYSQLISTITAESLYLQDIQLKLSPHLLMPNPNLKSLEIGKKNSISIYDQAGNSAGGSIFDVPDFFGNFPNLEVLIVPDRKISSLEFLEPLENLKTLDLRDNYISDVSALTSLENLEVVILENNPVSNSELLPKDIYQLTGQERKS